MYIWILLATIMVALSFYNVSPRADKDHVLNEVRAATVSNRFKIEHKAILKTMECEIMYQRNDGCWDTPSHSGNDARYCTDDDERQSAALNTDKDGAVDVSCFNPMFYSANPSKCSGRYTITVGNDTMQTFFGAAQAGAGGNGGSGGNAGGDENPTDEENPTGEGTGGEETGGEGTETPTPSVTNNTGKGLDGLLVNQYNYFTKHVPYGYDTSAKSIFPYGVHHYVYCLDEVAERATKDNFIRCDMKVGADYDKSKTTEKTLSSRTRYLVSFARMSEKWLSKKDRSPLPILVNMLAKDSNSDTVFGWTVCDGNNPPKCKLYGLNARHGNIRHKEQSKHYDVNVNAETGEKKITRKKGETGVSVNILTYDTDTEGNRKVNTDYVLEYEKLPDDSVFWENKDFREDCKATPCMFAYQRIPAIDTAYHCYNLMVGFAEGKTKDNDWKNKHKDKPINQPINQPSDGLGD